MVDCCEYTTEDASRGDVPEPPENGATKMERWITGSVALVALALIVGCCGSGKSDAELEEALDRAFEEAFEEMAKEAEEAVEEAAAEADGGGGGPCEEYSRCCSDYVAALGRLPDYPAESVDVVKQGCEAMEQLVGTPGGDEACKGSLDALELSVEGMAAVPGWETPASCK